MSKISDKSTGVSDSSERPLIDSAWAQFEALAAGRKPPLFGVRHSLVIPGYRILREIHRGGQGVVYQAMQESTHRKVAIKVLKEGPLADLTELTRFDREVDILSRLNHPHIVAIHDRGLAAGHAFFVMDYVPGRPLDAYVAGADLSTREILELFRKMCEAVNVAHLRGVIHRDLKPGNTRIDDEGEPHILDFGLAKLTRDAASSAAPMTITGQFVGSLPWASPEQAEGQSDLVDIRTDVYSLGVILYQLLTGTFPYPVSGQMNDVVHSIVHANPIRPSMHARNLDRDVEVILLKCLEKEPERRYQSAGELARDIQRFMNEEPIEARPASSIYQLRQFARRNKIMIAAAAAVFAALALGTTVSTFGFIRATRAEKIAVQRSEESVRAAEKAATINSFLQEMLSSVDPAKALGREVTIRQALDEAATKIESGSLKNQPAVEADLRSTIGMAYHALGHYPQADQHVRTALALRRRTPAPADSALAAELVNMAEIASSQGRHIERESFQREALAIFHRLHAGDHQDVAGSLQGLAASLRSQGRLAEAEPQYVAALEMRRRLYGTEHIEVAQSLNSLALLAQNNNDLETAERLFREALAMRRKLLGEAHPVVADALNNLANLFQLRRRFLEAEPLLREALQMRRNLFGDEHPATAQSLNNLGWVMIEQKDIAAAEPLLCEALAIWQKTLPPVHIDIAIVSDQICQILLKQNNYSEAETLIRNSLAIREALQPPTHPRRLGTMALLGEALARQQKFEEAETLLLKAYDGFKGQPPSNLKNDTLTKLIQIYDWWNKTEEAAEWRAVQQQTPSAAP